KNPKTLKRIVEKLSPLPLIDTDSDIKGDAFEYFLKSVTHGNKDLGEYFTPRHVIDMCVKMLNPKGKLS
ncbi:MAG: N-6 DNA methylase, partial [Nanoarchaeota archaeon]|nr:N-6 DNA methylase [Nanoarchaeota archaeon]